METIADGTLRGPCNAPLCVKDREMGDVSWNTSECVGDSCQMLDGTDLQQADHGLHTFPQICLEGDVVRRGSKRYTETDCVVLIICDI